MKKLLWKIKYSYFFWKEIRFKWIFIWGGAGASYENDPDENPKDAASEDISNFSD